MTELNPMRTESKDPRAVKILAKSVSRELEGSGLAEHDAMSFADELLSLVADEEDDEQSRRG